MSDVRCQTAIESNALCLMYYYSSLNSVLCLLSSVICFLSSELCHLLAAASCPAKFLDRLSFSDGG